MGWIKFWWSIIISRSFLLFFNLSRTWYLLFKHWNFDIIFLSFLLYWYLSSSRWSSWHIIFYFLISFLLRSITSGRMFFIFNKMRSCLISVFSNFLTRLTSFERVRNCWYCLFNILLLHSRTSRTHKFLTRFHIFSWVLISFFQIYFFRLGNWTRSCIIKIFKSSYNLILNI